MVSRSGWIRIFSGLPRPSPLPAEQRDVKMPVRLQRLALEAGPDDPDHLAGAAQRLVVGHPVEPLDHLRPRGAQPEHRPAAGDVVEPGGGLQDRAGGAREDVEDAGGDLEPSRSWRRGSPSASASRSRRPRPPRPCRARPSRARRPRQRWRGGCRRTGGESRAAPRNCDSGTVTVARLPTSGTTTAWASAALRASRLRPKLRRRDPWSRPSSRAGQRRFAVETVASAASSTSDRIASASTGDGYSVAVGSMCSALPSSLQRLAAYSVVMWSVSR